MLRASARELMRDRYPPDRIAQIADGDGFNRGEWRAVAQLGWIGISVPEGEGGAGLGFFEELILAEELGRGLYPGPFLSCVVLALPLLRLAAGAPDLVAGVVSGERIATVAWAGPEGTFDLDPAPKLAWEDERLSGVRLFVPDLRVADLLVVLAGLPDGTGIWAVDRDASGVTWRELPTIDSTRRMGEVTLEEVPGRLVGVLQPGQAESVRDRALAVLAAEAVGVGQAALDMALEHARTRVQFGRPIGAFQAVSHQLAQGFVEVETARSLAYWAGWAVAEGEREAPASSAAAKARASQAAVDASERAIQVHGGIGFTWEHPLHRWYKRALGISAFMGWGAEHRARVASAILD